MALLRPWGKSAAIDLTGCEHKRLVSADLLRQFVGEMVTVVGMISHGECYIDRFGEGKIKGYSAMQFIKTSSITVHLDETGNRAFIDVFTCKDFDPQVAVDFAQRFFKAKKVRLTVLDR